MKLSLRPKCTCGSTDDRHRLSCDMWYMRLRNNKLPKKKKRFLIFYPLRKV